MNTFLRCSLLSFCFVTTLGITSSATAGDWPQILGPHRNCIADDEKLLSSWLGGKPALVWKMDVGHGYAGLAIADGTAVLFQRVKDEEVATAIDALTGKPLWNTAFPTQYSSGIAPDDGPRCVPLLHKGRVFLYGAQGDLHCLSLKDGQKIWSRRIAKDFDAPEGYFGSGSTPIIVGDKLLVNVGGRNGAGIVAVSLDEGKTLWKSVDDTASYSAPTTAIVDGVEHTIFATRLKLLSLDASDGKVRWQIPFGKRGPTVNAATPLVVDGGVFASASYGVGALYATIGKSDAKKVWESDDSMSSQYSTCAYYDGHLFGLDGRQDQGTARLRCIEPKTGKVLWTESNFGAGNLILAGDKLLILKIDGTLVLAAASPDKYRPLASTEILPGTCQPLPALAHGLLYVRDDKTLSCLQVGEK